MEVKKVCKNCGKTFVTEDRHKICCCYKCRNAYEQMMKRLNGLPTRHSVSEAVKGFENKKLLSPSQAAEYLGLSRMTLYNYIATGIISCVDLPGRKLISRDELDTLFKNNTHKAAVSINFNDYITFYQMCDVYHRSYNFVRNVCKEQGLKPIIRSSIKYFRKDLVKDAFYNHDLLVKDAKAERDRFYALKHEARRSHEYINEHEVEHSSEEYSYKELMTIFHMDRNQVFSYARKYGVRMRHVNRFCLFNKHDIDEIFSTTPPFNF